VSDAFTRFEHDGWERVAARYEAAWSALTRPFVAPLLDAAGVEPGDRVLDVACGPGYAAGCAVDRGARAIGVDFSAEMVRLARARRPDLDVRVGDAQALPFPAGSFDAVVMNFGALHLAEPEAAFREAARVLAPGGRLAFTVWAGPEHSQGAAIVDAAVRAHASADAALPDGPPYFAYQREADVAGILGRCGFEVGSVRFRTETISWRIPHPEFLFEAERDAGVRTTAVLAAQSARALEAIRRDIREAVLPLARGGGYEIPFAAHVIAAGVAQSNGRGSDRAR